MGKIPTTLIFIFPLLFLRLCSPQKNHPVSAAIILKKYSAEISQNDSVRRIPVHPLPPDIIQLIQSVSYDGGCPDTSQYGTYNDADTHYYDISVDYSGKYYLIEDGHYCGEHTQSGGSCGNQIWVLEKDKNGNGKILLDECGEIDSVLSTSHNGMFDFKLFHSLWYTPNPEFYRYTGKEVIAYDDPKPISEREAIVNALSERYPKRWFAENSALCIEYENFGKTLSRFAVVTDGVFEKYILRSRTPGNYEVVNYFPEAAVLDILETKTNSMNDIMTWNGIAMKKMYWKWNGNEYVNEKK